ncbi:helix-turn-helix domain-containing protein [Pseudoclavibacter helvolus]|uniref:helix-turn-helix domain-containing protein n=1 Tax=Pseudoclavibacter helvolus TaxID=255205 RepID=UPI003D15D21D
MFWDEVAAARLGASVRLLREGRGLSQESLAFQAGITKNQLQLIEAGRSSGRREAEGSSNPRMRTLFGISTVLEVSASELIAAAGL